MDTVYFMGTVHSSSCHRSWYYNFLWHQFIAS